jgi:hypothetical protein
MIKSDIIELLTIAVIIVCLPLAASKHSGKIEMIASAALLVLCVWGISSLLK